MRPRQYQSRSLEDLGVIDLLERDERPTFVIDLAPKHPSTPIYYNPPLRSNLKVQQNILGQNDPHTTSDNLQNATYSAFLQWLSSDGPRADGHANGICYSDVFWIATTLKERFKVIAGNTYVYGWGCCVPEHSKNQSFADSSHKHATSGDPLPYTLAGKSAREEDQNTLRTKPPPSRLSEFPGFVDIASSPGKLDLPRSPVRGLTKTPKLTSPRTIPPPPKPSRMSARDEKSASPHIRFFQNYDWASTALGPMHTWSTELRMLCNVIMCDPRATAIFVGEAKTIIYNESYAPVLGKKHPYAMGKPFDDAWQEVADYFHPVFESANTGQTNANDSLFFLERNGYVEETYISWAIMALYNESHKIAYYNACLETTRQTITDRRMSTLLRLGQTLAAARTINEFWPKVIEALEPNVYDVPFAMLYSAGDKSVETLSTWSNETSSRHWSLEGTIGWPPNEATPPDRLETDRAAETFVPNFSDIIRKARPVLLQQKDDTFLRDPVEAVEARGFGDRCHSAVFCPIRPTSGEGVLGFLVLGINPRKAYDEDYQLFVQLLDRHLTTSVASALLFEQEIARERRAAEMAALDRNELSNQLAIRTQDYMENDLRFRRMCQLAPVGMFHMDAEGTLQYANDNYYDLTRHPRDSIYPMSWYNVIHPGDLSLMDREWAKLAAGLPVHFELRLKPEFVAEDEIDGIRVQGDTWILAAAYPEKRASGEIYAIVGCITDISRQKWMADFHSRRRQEAVDRKRQQENFIDITSHEMRNPLSAIIQCADAIEGSLMTFKNGKSDLVEISRELIESHIDSAQTILLCAQHQKRIIDDVLTLSKMESDLLSITPVEVQPEVVVFNALKMFDRELQQSDMTMSFHVEPTYRDLRIDWVRLDPSRLLQVLLNLVTNAIKFTRTQTIRNITISIGASIDKPLSAADGVSYLPRSGQRKDVIADWEEGPGKTVFIRIKVQDTGCGLDANETKRLFQRFSQASTKTHVQYGGSGLGLFISRELTEMQGGEIGLSSKSGIGSTFAFNIKAQPCGRPRSNSSSALLPLAIDIDSVTAELHPIPGSTNAITDRVKEASNSKGTRKHVLVVEDNLVNQKVMSKQLQKAGCVVSVANHGGEALEQIQASRFWKDQPQAREISVVLMDLEMPVVDGLTCIRQIRALQAKGDIQGHVPVIAVTANARSEQIQLALQSGMDSVVTKPFRIPELVRQIDRLLQRQLA